MTANPRALWTVGSTPPRFRGGKPSSPSPYKGEENDGPSFLVPWSAPHAVNECLNLYTRMCSVIR